MYFANAFHQSLKRRSDPNRGSRARASKPGYAGIESGIRVIGDFVLLVTAGFENFHRPFEDPRFLFGVSRKFDSLMLPKKLSVFLDRQAISRNMVRSQADGLAQTLLPRFD